MRRPKITDLNTLNYSECQTVSMQRIQIPTPNGKRVAPAPRSVLASAWPVRPPRKSSPCPQGFPHTVAHWASC